LKENKNAGKHAGKKESKKERQHAFMHERMLACKQASLGFDMFGEQPDLLAGVRPNLGDPSRRCRGIPWSQSPEGP
jgi:hypothetical protein